MGRLSATFGGLAVLAVVAAGLTEATLAFGGRGSLSNDSLMRPRSPGSTPIPKSAASPTPTASPTPAATPVATPVPTVAVPTATTNSYPIVHLRAGKSLSAAVITDIDGGTVVELLPDSDAQWQQVRYNNLTGYIYRIYLTY